MPEKRLSLPANRLFDPEPDRRSIAVRLYRTIDALPVISPHGHVDPRLFDEPAASLGTPADLFIIPDHYVFRMLYSQGIALERLGIPTRQEDRDGVERDHRKIWQIFADHYYLFRGTPTRIWLDYELYELFGVRQKLDSSSAQAIYDLIAEKLQTEEYQPRRLYERFRLEVLATTDAATDDLPHHSSLRSSGWTGRIIPTFRPDSVVHIQMPEWRNEIDRLSHVSGISVVSYASYIQALEQRREAFKALGATATDHAALTPFTAILEPAACETIFQHALAGELTDDEARQFGGHMLVEMARMSTEDGLVMQLHPGSFRDHNPTIYRNFGRDKGADIPISTAFTQNLKPLLDRFGNDPRLKLILFTLDEMNYGRELAPLAGHYPAVLLGPPWWFNDSLNGMGRFLDQVIETAGIYNTAGFNDDTRAFASIPARHDVWRRVCANWLAGLVVRGVIDEEEAAEMAFQLAYGLAKRAYRLT
jgi:glucuronate isomerase